jgi:hypothetical protein
MLISDEFWARSITYIGECAVLTSTPLLHPLSNLSRLASQPNRAEARHSILKFPKILRSFTADSLFGCLALLNRAIAFPLSPDSKKPRFDSRGQVGEFIVDEKYRNLKILASCKGN